MAWVNIASTCEAFNLSANKKAFKNLMFCDMWVEVLNCGYFIRVFAHLMLDFYREIDDR